MDNKRSTSVELRILREENAELKEKLERAYLLIDELNEVLLDNDRLRTMLKSEKGLSCNGLKRIYKET